MFQQEILEHIKNIESILQNNSSIWNNTIPTLLGVITGFVLSFIPNMFKKTKVFLVNYSLYRFIADGGWQDQKTASSYETTDHIKLVIEFDILNLTNSNVMIRNLQIHIHNKSYSKLFKIEDMKTWSYNGLSESVKSIDSFNIPSQNVFHINGRVYIDSNECKSIKENFNITIAYLNNRNKKVSKTIIKAKNIEFLEKE